jgi:hypothetical protein
LPNITVSLFEAEGFEQALNVLNSLNVATTLDIVSIVEKGGLSSLERVFERISSDPLWEIHVFPIVDMLKTIIEDGSTTFVDRFGLPPGRFSLQVSSNSIDKAIAGTVEETCTTDVPVWLKRRSGCFSCRHLRMCGTRFSPGSGSTCEPGIIGLLDKIHAQGEKMRSVMQVMIANNRPTSSL